MPPLKLYSAAALAAVATAAFGFFKLLTIIVISGTSSIGNALFRGWWTMPENCDCTARASICSASTAVNFTRQFEFATGRRPGGDHEQNSGDHKINTAKDGGGDDGAPDLHQREIGR